MINITNLQKSAENALVEVFAKSFNQAKSIEVFEHTEEIFDSSFEGVAVWCDVNFKSLSWFEGNPGFIISYSKELCEGSIDLFLGDECTDLDKATDAADGFFCDDVWHIEQIDDFLMLQATFTLESPDELEKKLISKLNALEDQDFAQAIRAVARYFE